MSLFVEKVIWEIHFSSKFRKKQDISDNTTMKVFNIFNLFATVAGSTVSNRENKPHEEPKITSGAADFIFKKLKLRHVKKPSSQGSDGEDQYTLDKFWETFWATAEAQYTIMQVQYPKKLDVLIARINDFHQVTAYFTAK